MEPTQVKSKISIKDFFLNLGAIVALYTSVVSLVTLLFTVIDRAFPPVSYNYFSSSSISWPVSVLIIFFPVFILLMWLLEAQYKIEPERQNQGIHKWLTFITLFLAGLTIAIDLITALYKFINGDDLTTGFFLKVLTLLVIAGGIFMYYISDVRGTLTSSSRMMWRVISGVLVIGSIVWGFSVLGSPATQRLYKHDDAKIMDLQNINYAIENYYSINNRLPKDFAEIATVNYGLNVTDLQTQKPYEYTAKDKDTYEVCAEFNKASTNVDEPSTARPIGYTTWSHPAGRHCFEQTINPNMYPSKI